MQTPQALFMAIAVARTVPWLTFFTKRHGTIRWALFLPCSSKRNFNEDMADGKAVGEQFKKFMNITPSRYKKFFQ